MKAGRSNDLFDWKRESKKREYCAHKRKTRRAEKIRPSSLCRKNEFFPSRFVCLFRFFFRSYFSLLCCRIFFYGSIEKDRLFGSLLNSTGLGKTSRVILKMFPRTLDKVCERPAFFHGSVFPQFVDNAETMLRLRPRDCCCLKSFYVWFPCKFRCEFFTIMVFFLINLCSVFWYKNFLFKFWQQIISRLFALD